MFRVRFGGSVCGVIVVGGLLTPSVLSPGGTRIPKGRGPFWGFPRWYLPLALGCGGDVGQAGLGWGSGRLGTRLRTRLCTRLRTRLVSRWAYVPLMLVPLGFPTLSLPASKQPRGLRWLRRLMGVCFEED